MKFIPILFSTEMVKAILSGSKVQTRRVVKPQAPEGYDYLGTDTDRASGESIFYACWEGDQFHNVKCPYGQVGDVLWVREAFSPAHAPNEPKCYLKKADFTFSASELVKWKPSIHMPKEACRLFLKINDIRVERLQDISDKSAFAEGIETKDFTELGVTAYKLYGFNDWDENPINSFCSLWTMINGEQSWRLNPWVWVIEFERIEKPENF